MKLVKTFEEFKKELIESQKVNEGLLDAVKDLVKKVGDWFKGTGSGFLNLLIKQEKGLLPKGVKIYPNKADLAILAKEHVPYHKLALPESYTSIDDEPILEAMLKLEHPDSDIENIDTEEFKFKIESQIRATQKGREPGPILIWGAPGIGKTAIIEAIGSLHDIRLNNSRLLVFDLATMRPEDFFLPAAKGGVNKEFTDQTRATRLPVDLLPVYDVRLGEKGDAEANGIDGKGGLMFFDEIARCAPEIQDVLLKLCDDSRRIGNYKLGSKWSIICAANRASDESDADKTYRFSSTLGNRFAQYNFTPTFADWSKWAESAKDRDGDMIVDQEILTFLSFFEEYWHKIDPEAEDTFGDKKVIFPTPRAWTNASIRLKHAKEAARELKKEFTMKDVESAISGSVGKSAASEFIGFLEICQKINPKDVLKVYTDPTKAPTLKGLNLAQQKGLMASVIMNKSKVDVSDKELENFIDWLIILDDERMAMRILSRMIGFHPDWKNRNFYAIDMRAKFFDHYSNLKKHQ